MKILITSIGSRGDVQPILALALELQALGQQPLICAAPNFQAWVESYRIDFVPIGPDLEKWTAMPRPTQPPSQEQLRELARHTVEDQFRVVTQAAQGCDLIVVGGMLQIAGRSVAEALKIPYVYAAYCPTTLPSPDYPPAKMGAPHPQNLTPEENQRLWQQNEESYSQMFRDPLNEQRTALGLEPVSNMSQYITTDHPLLAADPVLGPAGTPINMNITQTGAWLLSDPAALPELLESFLANGQAPIYFGFGSMAASAQTAEILVKAAHTVGRRAIISQGWANLNVIADFSPNDVISIGSVNHEKLFPRVATIVHHGGAGTTTAAARAGKPQVIVPHVYDQFYWAHRVQKLGIGVSDSSAATLTVESLVAMLRESLKSETTICAAEVAGHIKLDGAHQTAEHLVTAFG